MFASADLPSFRSPLLIPLANPNLPDRALLKFHEHRGQLRAGNNDALSQEMEVMEPRPGGRWAGHRVVLHSFSPPPPTFFLSECCCILKRPLAGSIQPVKKLHKKILRCSTQGHASVTTCGFQTFCSLPRFNGRAQPSTWSCPQKLKAGDSLIIQNASQILHFASSLEHFPQAQPSFP